MDDGQFTDAEELLHQILSEEPGDAVARSVLALCQLELGRPEDALRSAQRAADIEPFIPYPHWVLGLVHARRGQFAEAEQAAAEALRLDPDDADHHALVAQVCACLERWPDALAQAERGLAVEPSHEGCANLRALALRQLGRTSEAAAAFAAAAEANPLNTFAVAGKGWSALAGGNHAEAQAAFRDALLFDPTSEWARDGLLAALKTRNPIYRQLFRYFIWMGQRSTRERTAYAIGGVLAYNFLRTLATAQPELGTVIWPVLIAYILFVVLTWLADPLLHLMLSFDSEGRRLLSADLLLGGRVVGACLGLAASLALTSAVLPSRGLIYTAAGVGFLCLPLAGVFECDRGWPRTVMAAYTAGLALLLAADAASEVRGGSLFALAVIGIVLGTWLARWLSSVRVAR